MTLIELRSVEKFYGGRPLLRGLGMKVWPGARIGLIGGNDEQSVPLAKLAGAPPAKEADAALDSALKKLVAMRGGPPGVIAVVQRGERRYVHTFGVANVDSGRRIRVEDRMRIASAAKAFSGAVALTLVSKGKLSLDDTIGQHLPELPEAWHEITLRQLLHHTSGIPDLSLAPAFQEALKESLTQAPPPEELLSFVEGEPLNYLSEVVAAGWAWASGGIVFTPDDLNTFIRGYVGGQLFDPRTRGQQRRVIEGGGSEPPGPGKNSAGLAILRYDIRCGTVWSHTGNTPGYTQFMAASSDGRRSVTVSVNTQLTPEVGEPGVFKVLRRAEALAVCAALAEDKPSKDKVAGKKNTKATR